ncbi:NusG domain II-containing protein [Fervidobacterium pennivorans subsp. shakshaketiis]|jgi:hypothetical protein|uniref:Uncharacterized protein n=1 Tax=Fervidobacterium pennivorans (strain DSM 9078 / Ven5) TaxID=771875 RepID=H9U9L1_FERPD|nr:NusG domain II-containing protein [Fervidobacterium pennivorans]AFG34204.1 hypothetical protein Ferpe_0042 [Fervidobacterium pennivorans DSM 9078]QIV77581.1 NusG domain II-containing protein [Fervidobacterium pennivorans subsp. keratinolyticus]
MAERKFLKLSDIVFVLVAIVLGITWYFIHFRYDNGNIPGTQILSVRIQGEEVFTVEEPGEFIIKNQQGKYITTLHFDGNRAWVTDSNCPDKICEKTGKIGPGGSIICVPNRMIIEFKTDEKKEKKEVDVETW